jgi:hypothetical protein
MSSTRLPAELRKRVLEAARLQPSPDRASVRKVTAGASIALVIAGLAYFFAFGGLHLGTRPAQVVAITAAGWLIVALVATWGAFGRGRSMLGRPIGWLVVVALATAPTLLLWFLMWTMMWPEASAPVPAFGLHLACFMTTIVFSLSPIGAFVIARRHSDPVHPRATGAALGAAAGAWAGVMIDLHCPVSATAHVIIGHLMPIVFLAVAGAWLGRRVLGIRS